MRARPSLLVVLINTFLIAQSTELAQNKASIISFMRLCCCLRCPSADTFDSSGYLLCMFLIALPSADTHYSSGCLMCRVLLRITTLLTL